MAEATNTHNYFQLSRLSRWHVESDAINQALAMLIEAQSRLKELGVKPVTAYRYVGPKGELRENGKRVLAV